MSSIHEWPFQIDDFEIPSKEDFTPLFWLIFSFILGIIFSPLSFGFLFLIFSFIPFEIYVAYKNYKFIGPEFIFWRGAYIFATVVGFILGRIIIVDDHSPFRFDYKEKDHSKKYYYDSKKYSKHHKKHLWCYNN